MAVGRAKERHVEESGYATEVSNRSGADDLFQGSGGESGEGGGAPPGSGGTRGTDCVFTRTVPLAILLPGGGCDAIRTGRADTRPEHGDYGKDRAGNGHGGGGKSVRAARGGRVSQYGGGAERRRHADGAIPEDAYSGRPAVLREVLLHSGRPGLSELRDGVRADWGPGVLESMVPGGGAADGVSRGGDSVLSHGHRLASAREGARGGDATGCLADGAAGARDRQRGVRGGGEPHWVRGAAGERPGVLGPLLRGRSVWRGGGRSRERPGRDAGGGVRPGAGRTSAAGLAVFPRPAYRRLRRPDVALARQSIDDAICFRTPFCRACRRQRGGTSIRLRNPNSELNQPQECRGPTGHERDAGVVVWDPMRASRSE